MDVAQLVELEVGEINPEGFTGGENSQYPHGVYVCGCWKFFHGHWNRTMHYAICPERKEREAQ